jgi:hypothetical protein
MVFQDGWSYVKGPIKYVWSTTSSTATFVARNPVTLSDDRTLIEAASDSTAIFGIAAHDAANSIPAALSGLCLVEVPTSDTVYAIKIGTGAATSEVSIGQSIDIEKSGDFIIGNEDSQASPYVTIVPRDDGSTLDSDDSTVFVNILGNRIGVMGSHSSITIFAQT